LEFAFQRCLVAIAVLAENFFPCHSRMALSGHGFRPIHRPL
jgi:hypothetical protein